MRRGRRICDTLKEIRQRIADANDIDYAPSECHHEGECAGTCPKCESEVQYLERELSRRQRMGRAVMVAGLGMGLAALSSCGKTTAPQTTCPPQGKGTTNVNRDLDGYVPMLRGDVVVDPDTTFTSKPVPAQSNNDTRIYGAVEPMPTYPGGNSALMQFISERIMYPEEAAKEGMEGTVYVKFIIKPDGSLVDHQVARSVDSRLDEEALRVVRLLDKFEPAPSQKVDIPYTIPITFALPKK